jgi:catechol 2,3-dioxygenase-like lactoylglutathione lyase family enzyme
MCSTRGCEGSATSDRPTRCGGDGSIGKKEAHMPGINGIAHVELSVRDLDKSVRWYCELLGAQDVVRATNDAYRITACAIFEPRSKLVLAFTQHREEEPSEFDPRRVGLDHLSLAVADGRSSRHGSPGSRR